MRQVCKRFNYVNDCSDFALESFNKFLYLIYPSHVIYMLLANSFMLLCYEA